MKPKKVLIMGLPGAGKTYLARKIAPRINAVYLNADVIRTKFNDWDFSDEGRLRQAKKMSDMADKSVEEGNNVIADFICPTPETRSLFGPDILVWMDTINEGRFENTNKIFVPPESYDFRITEHSEGDFWPTRISKKILEIKWNNKHPTVQLMGRWQPWHEGHRHLFERSIRKTGQVCIMVRDCHGTEDNPLDLEAVTANIIKDLSDKYEHGTDYIIHHIPNIVHISYGRNVGYTVEQEHFDEIIENISATEKRSEMRENGEL